MSSDPRLGVHMLVRNGAEVVGRALRSLCGAATELCYVDDASTDGTPDVLREVGREQGMSVCGAHLSPRLHPNLYFADVPGSFRRALPGDHSGEMLLSDWSAARNLCLGMATSRYVLKLDADDVAVDPINLGKILDYLDARPEVDVVMCPYEVVDGVAGGRSAGLPRVVQKTLYARIWRRRSEIVFREVCHENVDWVRRLDGSNWLMVPQGLDFRDLRDSPGAGVRVPYRNLKVLLREYERVEASPPGKRDQRAHVLAYMADEACEIFPDLAVEVLDLLLAPPQLPISQADLSWCLTSRGRALEKLGDLRGAREAYRLASVGSSRALVYDACAAARQAEASGKGARDARQDLVGALSCNRDGYYPRCASLPEMEEAERLLDALEARIDRSGDW